MSTELRSVRMKMNRSHESDSSAYGNVVQIEQIAKNEEQRTKNEQKAKRRK
jgi:hypothetical protein